MARIRSIKPEFWISERIASFDCETRLTFIGLWSYVDDNGVGRFNDKLITAALYPLDDPREALARVQRSLASLAAAGRIVMYEDAGRPLIYVTTWDEHQRVDRPNKARFERPSETSRIITYGLTCGNAEPDPPSPSTVATPSRHPRESPSPVVRSRGAGEQGSSAKGGAVKPPAADAAELDADTAQTLIGEWLEHSPKRPPSSVISRVGKHLAAMLAEGIDPADVRRGLAAWAPRGLDPSVLPSVVNEAMNGRPTLRAAPRPSTTDERVNAGLALARQFAERDGHDLPQLPLGGTA